MTRVHRRRFPRRRGRIAVLDVLSLARDIDTEEEALELTDSEARADHASAGPGGAGPGGTGPGDADLDSKESVK